MSPKVSDADLEQRRQHILDAAVRCFARYGFHEATLARICEEAGVSRGAVYHYFESKEDIIEALRERSQRDYAPLWEVLLSDQPAADALAEFVAATLEQMAEPGSDGENRLGILLWAEALLNPRVLDSQVHSMTGLHELLAQVIERGRHDGTLDPELDAHYLSCVLIAIFLGFQVQCGWEPSLEPRKAADVAEVLLARALRPRSRPPSPDQSSRSLRGDQNARILRP